MSEEQKAIETLNNVLVDLDDAENGAIISLQQNEIDSIKIILNLTEKQQKEIEDLKEITQNYNAIGGETFGDDRIIVCSMKYFDNGYFKKNYIFKDKIREKIKEKENKINDLYFESDAVLIDDLETEIKALKELLYN